MLNSQIYRDIKNINNHVNTYNFKIYLNKKKYISKNICIYN